MQIRAEWLCLFSSIGESCRYANTKIYVEHSSANGCFSFSVRFLINVVTYLTDFFRSSPPEVPSTSTLSGQAVYAPPFVPQAISRIASPKPKSLYVTTRNPVSNYIALLPTSVHPPPPSMSNNAYHDHDLYDPYAYHGSNGEIHPEYVNGTETYHQALQPTFVRQSVSLSHLFSDTRLLKLVVTRAFSPQDSRAYCEPLLPPLHWSPPPSTSAFQFLDLPIGSLNSRRPAYVRSTGHVDVT